MSKKTYAELMQDMAALKEKVDAAREAEIADVVAKIKVAIKSYGLTARDLGLATNAKVMTGSGKSKAGVKYQDNAGNTWAGMGKRPDWLKAALALGHDLEEFAVAGSAGGAAKPRKKTKPSLTLYADGTGKTWTGRGRKPGWVSDALAAGGKLEDLLVPSQSKQGSASAPATKSATPPASKKATAKSAKKKVTRKVKPLYKDDAGNSWSGRGSQPRWFRDALAAGKTEADLKIG